MTEKDFVILMKEAFLSELPESEIFVFDNIDSTNTRAKEYALENGKKSAFFIAKSQSGGRGRRGRSFLSNEGGLYLSYLCYPELLAKDAIKLTVFAAVALAETVLEFSGKEVGIKWVNDLILGEKKLAGILTEGEFCDSGKTFRYAVVGIGVNLYRQSFGEELSGIATDLESESGERVDIYAFAVSLAKRLASFETSRSQEYMEKYRKLSVALGRRVSVTDADGAYPATALEIKDSGALLVRLDSGEERELNSGEISIRLENKEKS